MSWLPLELCSGASTTACYWTISLTQTIVSQTSPGHLSVTTYVNPNADSIAGVHLPYSPQTRDESFPAICEVHKPLYHDWRVNVHRSDPYWRLTRPLEWLSDFRAWPNIATALLDTLLSPEWPPNSKRIQHQEKGEMKILENHIKFSWDFARIG